MKPGQTIGRNLLNAIGNTTEYPITHEVYSHAHADHIGASFLYGDVKRIAHRETKEILELTNDLKRRPLPDVVFDDKYELKAGNQTLQLAYRGVDHEAGNIYVFAPVQRVLMKVDIVFPGWVPFAYLAESERIPGFIKAHDFILDYEFDYFVGGHLTRAGNRTDVELQREYVLDLQKAVDEAIDLSAKPPSDENPISFQRIFKDSSDANPDNVWALFETYLEALARFAESRVIDKWLGVLGGADVYTFENCYQMLWSERVDGGRLGPLDVAAA
jgi:glyoxylase-like metal-dependent hydrolase (beta-lactamase superfamily II)